MNKRRYTYATNIELSSGDEGGPDFDVKVSFTCTPGAPVTPPSYASGGSPAEDPEIDDIRLETVGGKPRPWGMYDGMIQDEDDSFEEVIVGVLENSAHHLAQMVAEAAETDAADHDAAMEARRDG